MTFPYGLLKKLTLRGLCNSGFLVVLSTTLLTSLDEVRALAQTPTVVLNDQAVIQPSTKRVGLNLGSISFYDTGQVLKNLIGTMNPGFEPLIDQQIWVVNAPGTTSSFAEGDQYDRVPAGYWTGASFKIVASQSGGAELGCTGTIADNTGPNKPTYTGKNPVFTTAAPCAAPFSTGDIVQVSLTVPSTPESWWENSQGGVWGQVASGGKLLSNNKDLCPTCGTQSLDLDATAAGSSATASSYFDSAPQFNLFVLMNGTYEISFWAKAASGTPNLAVTAGRMSAGGFDCGSQNQPLTPIWTQYTLSCIASETAKTTTPGNAYVSFGVTGGAVYLDNTSFQKVGTDAANTTVFRDEVFNTLKNYYNVSSGGNSGMLRDWLGQNGETFANWTAPDYAHKPSASGAGYFIGPSGSGQTQLSLEDYLNLCKALNAEPYLEVPVTISEQDASSLIEFLAGSSSSAGGTRRAALGQTDSWTSQFNMIHLSYCNECWNGSSFVGQSLSSRGGAPNSEFYYDYSVRAASIFAAMRSNPSYSQSAFDLVMNAQTAINWSMDAAIQRAHPDSIEIEDYTYGNVSSFATDTALWQPAFVELYGKVANPSDPSNFYQSLHDYQNLNACGASGTATCGVNVYEWGSGTLAGSIDQTHLDSITAGAGTGIISALQPLLNLQTFGIQADSYFALTEFQNGSLNGNAAKVWGITVDMGGATNNVRPQYLGVSLVNQSIIGPMYACPISNNLTYNFAGSSTNGTAIPPGIPAANAVPYLYSFCFQNGSNRSIVLINTDLTASHTVSFSGTNTPYGTVTERQYAPSSPDLLNESPSGTPSNLAVAKVGLTTGTLTNPTSITLPPMSATALDFVTGHATTGGTTATPNYSVASGTYTAVQTVAINDTTGGASIFFTTDGSTPTSSSPKYLGPLLVSSTQAIRAIATSSGSANSGVAIATYTITKIVATPTFSLPAGTYASAQSVSISDATPGATLYYTTNGASPTTASTVYSGPIRIAATETLKAVAIANGYTNSLIALSTYTVTTAAAAAPAFSPAAGTYPKAQTITIGDATPGAAIYYTTNGGMPTTSSTRYNGAFTVSSTQTIKAIAVATGYANSSLGSATYSIVSMVVAAPTFSVVPGTYAGTQLVSINDETPGATIYFNITTSASTTAPAAYTGPISVSATEIINSAASASGYENSAIASGTYTIQAPGTTINFGSGFASAAPLLSMNGSAQRKGSSLQLTAKNGGSVGSFWNKTPMKTDAFTTDFTFQLTHAVADGFAFVIQNDPKGFWALGAPGGSLGYAGVRKSVAVKFDLYNNLGEGDNSTGLYTNGAVPALPFVDLTPTGVNLHSGNVIAAHIVYNGTTLTMTLTDKVTAATYTTSWPVDIAAAVGGSKAYVGFTGGVGGLTAIQDIQTWTYRSN